MRHKAAKQHNAEQNTENSFHLITPYNIVAVSGAAGIAVFKGKRMAAADTVNGGTGDDSGVIRRSRVAAARDAVQTAERVTVRRTFISPSILTV